MGFWIVILVATVAVWMAFEIGYAMGGWAERHGRL